MNRKDLQCKQEKYAGGGCPSPRECGICGLGPCTKSQTTSKEVDDSDYCGHELIEGFYKEIPIIKDHNP